MAWKKGGGIHLGYALVVSRATPLGFGMVTWSSLPKMHPPLHDRRPVKSEPKHRIVDDWSQSSDWGCSFDRNHAPPPVRFEAGRAWVAFLTILVCSKPSHCPRNSNRSGRTRRSGICTQATGTHAASSIEDRAPTGIWDPSFIHLPHPHESLGRILQQTNK